MLIHTPKALASFCSSHRRSKKLSQAYVGTEVCLKQTTVSKFELKPDNTHLDTLFRILAALDLEMQIVPKEKSRELIDQKKWTEEW